MKADFASGLAVMAFIWLALRLSRDWFFLTRPRIRALGTVVDHDKISGEGGETPLLVVRFETDDGQVIDVRDSLGPPSHQIDVGSLVGVEYPSGYPKQARLLQSRGLRGGPCRPGDMRRLYDQSEMDGLDPVATARIGATRICCSDG